MSRMMDYGNENSNIGRQRDLVLSVNEFVFLQNKTNGQIKTQAGPMTITISQQEALVIFNAKSKKFEETNDFERAKQLFIAPPEGWYTILKNPTSDGQYPEAGKANTTPSTITVGKKINIPGPASFALFPGQMAKTVRGHKLRSNQYLLARVYDAEAAQNGLKTATIVDANGNETEAATDTKYFVGQLLVIKGTEISFYIPPTGIEVIPQTPYGDDYVRDAVTLERLEYAILKDENGSKRYEHGPAVVFPEPTETFVKANEKKGNVIFRALELSPISGIYLKVIADYTDENGVEHKTGEELFITGNEQQIFYPREELALIQYDGKYMHHAIAIPEGEGRYIMDRITGEIKTVKGYCMYLPDPRTEVVVQRKLSDSECELMYPGNTEVKNVNAEINERQMEKLARKGMTNQVMDSLNNVYSTANMTDSLALFEVNANISRGSSYTKPRTITLDTKYDGVVSIDVWTGYAINVVSKSGERKVVIGPTTTLLDYDETIEALHLDSGTTGFMQISDIHIKDKIVAQTKDYVKVMIDVSYLADFDEEKKDSWFSVNNYEKYLKDVMRNRLKNKIKTLTVQEFYNDYVSIVENTLISEENEFKNGMILTDVEVQGISMENEVAALMDQHQKEVLSKTIQLQAVESEIEVEKKLAEAQRKKMDLKAANDAHEREIKYANDVAIATNKAELQTMHQEIEAAKLAAEQDMAEIRTMIEEQKLQSKIAEDNARIETEQKLADIEAQKYDAYALTVAQIMESIQPGLIEALNANANANLIEGIGEAVAPYAIAKGDSIAETVNTMLRGTSLQDTIKNIKTYDIK